MIIKKNKNQKKTEIEDNAQEQTIEQSVPEINLFEETFGVISDRQERRRGDRRRGYRRTDDRNLISRAQEESNTLREKATKDGFNQGLITAGEEIQNLKTAIGELIDVKNIAMQKASKDIVFIATKVAEKIIKTEVACDETIILNIVSEVLNDIGNDESKIIIKTNPSDVNIIKNNLPNLFQYGNANAKIIVMPDNKVEKGSCTVKTTNCLIDATISTQLELISKAFEEGL